MRRVSLACTPCRSRHLSCDGQAPRCSRCSERNVDCTWQKSRRRGRPRKSAPPGPGPVEDLNPTSDCQISSEALYTCDVATDDSASLDVTLLHSSSHVDAPGAQARSSLLVPGIRQRLLEAFYGNFFDAHPCVLPRRFHERWCVREPSRLKLLDTVMQFVGSLYVPQPPRLDLELYITSTLSSATFKPSAYDIQAMIIYATAAYWRNEMVKARCVLDRAIDGALEIGLHLKQFATHNANGDTVLAESWRRAWWMLYMTDIHMAAMSHSPTLRTSRKSIFATTELPCEDAAYVQGEIPSPSLSVEQYQDRDLLDDNTQCFSSFAHVIGLAQCFDETILGHQRETSAHYKSICVTADSAVKSWLTLLPRSKRDIVKEDGSVDSLMFRAILEIPVYIVDIHRSLSSLKYSEIESISTCSPPPPPENLPPSYLREIPSHTSKIVDSIELMTETLLLPCRLASQTPFAICMISATTIVHLSACKYIFQGEQLANARKRVKVAIGALKALAEIWPRAETILQQVKTIARALLLPQQEQGIEQPSSEPPTTLPSLSGLDSGKSSASTCSSGLQDWDGFDAGLFALGDPYFSGNILGDGANVSSADLFSSHMARAEQIESLSAA